jgi:probable phosphomutase (TIGR03848 family)
MSTIILLRHAHSQANEQGLLAGRKPGVLLSSKGRKQADELINRIGKAPIDFLHISPMQRCHLTINPWLASRYSSSITKSEIDEAFDEVDYGNWSGKSLASLRRKPLWKTIQQRPSLVTFPEGESMRKAQKRAISRIDEILSKNSKKTHLIVTHSDLIKMIVAHYLGTKLDNFQKIQIDPATFTVLSGNSQGLSIRALNSSDTLGRILGN